MSKEGRQFTNHSHEPPLSLYFTAQNPRNADGGAAALLSVFRELQPILATESQCSGRGGGRNGTGVGMYGCSRFFHGTSINTAPTQKSAKTHIAAEVK